jgi:PAS domain S-box-containing protein
VIAWVILSTRLLIGEVDITQELSVGIEESILIPIERAITEIALKPRTDDDSLYRALSESLTEQGIGFVILASNHIDQLAIHTAYGPDGTSLLPSLSPSGEGEGHLFNLVLTEPWQAELDTGRVQSVESFDDFLKDPNIPEADILRGALPEEPFFAVRLNLSQTNNPLLLISTSEIVLGESNDVMGLASKLSLALEIIRLKANLEQAEAKHNWIFQTSDAALILLSAEGTILDLNNKVTDYTRAAREELIDKPIAEIFTQAADWFDRVSEVISATFHPSHQFEFVNKLGEISHLKIELLPLVHDPEGSQLLRIIDVSAMWRLEEMVRRLDHMKDGMAEHMSVGMILQDGHGNIAHVNDTASNMLGYPIEELLGEHWTKLFPEDQHAIVRKANLRRVCGESDRYEAQMLHKDGTRRDVLLSESPYEEAGKYAGTFAFITDLTDLRQAEAKVLQKNRDLERALERITALNQAASGALHAIDASAMMEAVGDELKQLGMLCLIATLDTLKHSWDIQHLTSPIEVRSSGKEIAQVQDTLRLPADMNSAWMELLQEGETLYLEASKNALEGLVPQGIPLQVNMQGFEVGPRILAPLSAGERLFGLLVVCGMELTVDDVPAITAFSNHLSIALEKARLLENTFAQAKLGQVLAEIATNASNELDLARLLESTGRKILDVLDVPCCTFSTFDPETETMSVLLSVVRSKLDEPISLPSPGKTQSLEEFPAVRKALDTDRILWMQDPGWNADQVELVEGHDGGLMLLVPMTVSGKAIGIGTFYLSTGRRRLSADEITFVQTGMEQISMAIEKVRLAGEAELQDQIDRSLSTLVERTLASREVNEVVEAALNGISSLLPCNAIYLATFDFERDVVRILGVMSGKDSPFIEGQIMSMQEWKRSAKVALGENTLHWSVEELFGYGSATPNTLNQGSEAYVSLPLNVRDNTIGNLVLGSRQPEAFTSEHMVLARRFANHLAVALANATNYEKAQMRADELSALYDLALEISGEHEMRSLFMTSIERATELVNSVMGAIFLVDPAIGEITLVAQKNLPPAASILNLRRGQGLAGRVWHGGEALNVESARGLGDPQWMESCYATGAAVGVPLSWDGEVKGVLAVFDPGTDRRYTPEEVQLLERLAAQVSIGIENVENHEQINRRVNQLRVVNDVARRISTILDQEQLFRDTVRRIAHSLNLELVILFLTEDGELVEKASYYLPQDQHGSWDPLHIKIDHQSICGKTAMEGDPILITNVANSPEYVRVLPYETKIRSAASVPLKLQGKVIGVLLAESERLAAFDNADLDALQALGAHISTSIDNARLYTQSVSVQSKMVESEKLRSLGLMTSGIAHDFNNLLAVILSRAELALRRADDEDLRHHLEQVIASAKDGGETIHRLQEFARTRKDTSDFIGLDLNEVVREAINLSEPKWKNQAQNAGIYIEVQSDLQADRYIHGAPAQLRDILINLIFNAVEAMPEGGLISIRTKTDEEGATLVISDTGIGMTEEVKEQIFVPFFTTKAGGTGLGLSMVYGVVQRHGGSIEIDTLPGQGTTIAIWLPTSVQHDLIQADVDIPSVLETLKPVTVLVVEDEELIRSSLVEALTSAGHRVLQAADGVEGLDLYLQAQDLDIIITDLGMPRLSGWRLIEQLRTHDTKLPIMIISGWGDEVSPERVLRFGVDKVIAKPFTVSDITHALQEVMSLRRIADETT